MTEIFTAKTVAEAKELASRKFGKRLNEIKFEIIEEGKKGFLGIGQVDAKIKATCISSASKSESSAVKPLVKNTASVKPEIKKEISNAEKSVESEIKRELSKTEETIKSEVKNETTDTEMPIKTKTKEETEKISDVNKDALIEDFKLVEDENFLHTKVKIAIDYITSILKAMDINAEFSVYQNETGAIIDIKSDNNGTVIGRRGETLDSIQYLCSIIVNKGDKDYFRITIDCLNYRNKRKETLEQLATKVAKSVIRSGRPQQLEPMNPYERRVIHSAISEIEGVSSRSVGEEPYRKIIISSLNPKNNKKKNRSDDRKGGRKNERKSRESFEPKAIDLSTSFEKDYKKPKPEDSIEGGLYGKIEF